MFLLHSKRSGFTLIELLVVIAIIGTLASTVLVSVQNARDAAWDAKVRSDVKSIQTALEIYRNNNNGNYPSGCCALSSLTGVNDFSSYMGGGYPTLPHPKFSSVPQYGYWSGTTPGSYILLVRFSRHTAGGGVSAAERCYVEKGTSGRSWATATVPCPEIPSSQ